MANTSNTTVIWWTEFCGNRTYKDALWNSSLMWNTQTPVLTDCLKKTLIPWAPCLFLLICLPFHITHLKNLGEVSTKRLGFLCIIKMIFGALLCLLSLALEGVSVVRFIQNGVMVPADITTPIILFLTAATATWLVLYERQKRVVSSGVLWWFWLLMMFSAGLILTSYIITFKHRGYVDTTVFSLFSVCLSLVLLQFILTLFVDGDGARPFPNRYKNTGRYDERVPLLSVVDYPKAHGKKPSPELNASYLSRITFSWILGFMIRGYRKSHSYHDLYDLKLEDSCQSFVPHFIATLAKAKNRHQPTWQLLKAIIRENGLSLITSGLWRFLATVTDLIPALLLSSLIRFVDSDNRYVWQGYLMAGLIAGCKVLTSVSIHLWLLEGMVAGMRLRSVMNAIVYRKALKLSSSARRQTTVGEIVNLMSIDGQKIQDSIFPLHNFWTVLLLVVVCPYLIYDMMGNAAFAGLLVLVILLPINAIYLAGKIGKLQIEQMKAKDDRLKVTSEVLSGMKVIKFYAWEIPFRNKIDAIRAIELVAVKYANFINAFSAICWFMSPYLVTLATFAAYVLSSPENVLTAEKAFVTLNLINLLNFPMSLLPIFIFFTTQGFVSLKRIAHFLTLEEFDSSAVSTARDVDGPYMAIQDGNLGWGHDTLMLKGINLIIPKGKLTAIVGPVGCGKSSIISAFLGEMRICRGNVTCPDAIAYVPQQAWIQNSTLQNNILFGKDFISSRYKVVIEACALNPDIESLPGGDQIEIGEKGINLSGGQKQRVSLARAVYQEADVYLLDDPLSAVDAHVSKHLFEKVVGPTGLLKRKTRVLATHSVSYLPHVDYIVIMDEGRVREAGSYEELLQKGGAINGILDTDHNALGQEEYNVAKSGWLTNRRDTIRRSPSLTSFRNLEMSEEFNRSGSWIYLSTNERETKHSLIEAEVTEIGKISWSVIWDYIKAGGISYFIFTVISHLFFAVAQAGTSIWLSRWTEDAITNGTRDRQTEKMRLGVYGALGVCQTATILIGSLFLANGAVRASRDFHGQLLGRILRAPLSFFDTTPLGRVMNRFSKDMDSLDSNMPVQIGAYLFAIAPLISSLIVICYTIPIFTVALLPISILYFLSQKIYIANVRQLKRIDSVKRSPLYAHFDESISGSASIRAYRKEDTFIKKCDSLIDDSQKAWYLYIIAMRCLGFWFETAGAFLVLIVTCIVVHRRDSINGGLAGLAITYSLMVVVFVNLSVRNASELETYVVSVERIKEYTELPQEAPWVVEEYRPYVTWPDQGGIVFSDYMTRFRPGLDLVLNRLNVNIRPGEKVGIVGRTGAGKSSLTLSLFRILEASSGFIRIDGIDIYSIGLHDLRAKLTIIPQDPVIFSGTLRSNLDPFANHTDEEVIVALGDAHLDGLLKEHEEGLEYNVGDNGEALSIGQRQLVCLARALLRQTKILVFDEATAAVDMETDQLIQTTIRRQFQHCTVLTIAHRLNTILDCDRVMVLDRGTIIEFDHPRKLLCSNTSVFSSMARDAGLNVS